LDFTKRRQLDQTMRLHVFLLYALLILNVTLRFFTNGLGLIPRIFNVVDIGIVGVLFLIFLNSRAAGTSRADGTVIIRRLTWFGFVLLAGSLLNLKYIYLPAALSQVVMLFEPVALFLSLINLPLSEADILKYIRILRRLIVLEISIGILQIPIYLKTGDSEALMGTFQHNAEQYAAFLLIGVFFFVGMWKVNPGRAKRYFLPIVAVLVMIVCIDNKASWLGLLVSLAFVLHKVGVFRSQFLRRFGPVILLVILSVTGVFVVSRFSHTLYKFSVLAEAWETDQFKNLGKVKAFLDIGRSHTANPYMMIVGSGPSTFYSRACRQFYFSPTARARMYSNPDMVGSERDDSGPRQYSASNSMGGVFKQTGRTPYYDRYYSQSEQVFAIGTIQVDSPFSPYAGLLGETGVLGCWLYLSIYVFTLKRLWNWLEIYQGDEKIFPLIVAAFGFLIYVLVNSIYGPFLETTRLTTILWSMIALVWVYVRMDRQRTQVPHFAGERNPTSTFAHHTAHCS
jgi:hypothetical protein